MIISIRCECWAAARVCHFLTIIKLSSNLSYCKDTTVKTAQNYTDMSNLNTLCVNCIVKLSIFQLLYSVYWVWRTIIIWIRCECWAAVCVWHFLTSILLAIIKVTTKRLSQNYKQMSSSNILCESHLIIFIVTDRKDK